VTAADKSVRRKKNIVGLTAIGLLLVLTVLAVMGIITAFVWIIADLIVALVANIVLRRIGKPKSF
jgi:hypothetical protein